MTLLTTRVVAYVRRPGVRVSDGYGDSRDPPGHRSTGLSGERRALGRLLLAAGQKPIPERRITCLDSHVVSNDIFLLGRRFLLI